MPENWYGVAPTGPFIFQQQGSQMCFCIRSNKILGNFFCYRIRSVTFRDPARLSLAFRDFFSMSVSMPSKKNPPPQRAHWGHLGAAVELRPAGRWVGAEGEESTQPGPDGGMTTVS